MTTTIEEIARVTFPASGIEHENDLEFWLDRARKEFFMSLVAADLINRNDQEVERFIHDLGDTVDERARITAEMIKWFKGWGEHYKAAHEVTETAFARLMIIAGRLVEGVEP